MRRAPPPALHYNFARHVPPETGDVSWQCIFCSGNIRPRRLKGISAKRSEDAKALFKKHGGELKAAYATLGGVDLVMIADLPDNARAMAASTALAKSTGIAFTTAPALTVDEFDKLAV